MGTILLSIFGALVILAITAQNLPLSVSVCSIGQLTTGLTILSLSYGVWQTWWGASLYLAAALMIAVSRLPKLSRRPILLVLTGRNKRLKEYGGWHQTYK